MASRYGGGSAFYEYLKQFSAKAAANLKYNNIPVDWSIRNNTLFCNIFANHKRNSCSKCHSVSHTTGFCPLSPYDFSGNNRRYDKCNNDTLCRQRIKFGCLEICNNYNGDKGCLRPRCNNFHVCLSCKKDHPKT